MNNYFKKFCIRSDKERVPAKMDAPPSGTCLDKCLSNRSANESLAWSVSKPQLWESHCLMHSASKLKS